MGHGVDLVIPVKMLDRAKTRLFGGGDRAAHEALVLAFLRDTAAAAAGTTNVRTVLVVSSDPTIAAVLTGDGIEVLPDDPAMGLNQALTHGTDALLRRDPSATVGALQADLPALRPEELGAALEEAGGRRAFVADHQGTGTTLLLAAPGRRLDPHFGIGSAVAHAASGALSISAPLTSLRCDVDTVEDLVAAHALGLGKHSCAAMGASCPSGC
ncbi:MAG TPA: 2-phospho-L-lactate guanylyltransferase [Pseudonocardiaceae bacterium]|nr:2-phospho-L-lactate guanylyltransferase [Pseudonocardiaceae bacterium]